VQEREVSLKEKIKDLSLSGEEIKELLEREEVVKNREYLILLLIKPAMVSSLASSFLPSLFPMDLVRVIKAPTTNIFVKQAALLNLSTRYNKLQKGEKKVLWRIIPPEFVKMVKEEDPSVLVEILKNSRLKENDLFYIIRKTRLNPSFIASILSNPKWKGRERILFALASKGYLSEMFLVNILSRFSKSHLKEFLKNSLIPTSLKKKIKEIIKK